MGMDGEGALAALDGLSWSCTMALGKVRVYSAYLHAF